MEVTVGGGMLNGAVDLLIRQLASPEVRAFFKCSKIDDGILLEKLTRTLNTVSVLLDDAEEKQLIKPAVKNWLDEVKDAVYEAEDLLDEIGYESQRLKFEGGSQTSMDQVLNFLSSKLNIFLSREKEKEEKLKKIFEKLDRAVKHKGDLRPVEGIAGGKSLSEKKGPLPDEFLVYGRDADREAIVELLKLNHENGPKVVAIPIVGPGGVDKTTLSQIVYKDRRVEDWFQLKAWVWVPEQFDVSRVIKDVIKEVNAKIIANKESDELLKEALKGKKFFLVLDNVWNIKHNEWQKLLLSLQDVELGSKIVVTTQIESVAKVIETVIPPHPLEGITDEECWLLFANHAFSGINFTAQSHFKEIGRKIASKCRGLPLAARTIGGLLHSKTDAKEWEMIAKSSMWSWANEKIPPALKLSYYYLPSEEKRCFSYCAIIPKGSTFQKDQLIMLWMAEGFLGKEEMEHRGNEYFDDLVSRSFFQQSRDDPSSFIMHDLTNDLAQYVLGEFCFKVGEFGSRKGSKRTRHFSHQLTDYNHVLKIFEDIQAVPPLRTFVSISDESKLTKFYIDLDERVLYDLLPVLNRLRVLSLPRQYWESYSLDKFLWVTPLLDSIGNLKHLRYLDLSAMSMNMLPETVSTLYYLQTLILSGCRHLIKLPTNMSNLINLQHLVIGGTDLRWMPSQMSKLTMLRNLTDFFLGKQNGSNLKELGKLVNLRGTLSIWDLQNIVNVQYALEADLKGKKHLEQLRLTWYGRTVDSQRVRDILEKLEPHSNLKSLVICGYGGRQFPDWVGDYSFSNITTLRLIQCENCTSLPPLGQLSLKQLCLTSLDGIVAIGSGFYGRCTSMKKPFASLQKLEFQFMLRWREWIPYTDSDDEGGDAFPLLKELWIVGCPNLTKALPILPSLSTLRIENCPQLVVSIPSNPTFSTMKLNGNSRYMLMKESSPGLIRLNGDFLLKGMEQIGGVSTFLQVIKVEKCNSLKCLNLELFPNLRSLQIKRCANLESLCANKECPMDSTSLTSLKIIQCPNLVKFPELHAPELRKLQLLECINLESLPKHMHSLLPSLVDLCLHACPKLELFPEGGFPSKLEFLEIIECRKLMPNRMQWHLQSLPFLSNFKIGPIRDMESFPEKMMLPSSLTSLTIRGLLNLRSLDSKELRHLTSLRKLEIVACSELETLPEEGLLSSLSSLAIWGCPLLEERLKKGEDLDKISHIPIVEINGNKTIFPA